MHRNKLPSVRYHKASGKAVLVLSGKSFYLQSPFGSVAAKAEGDRLIAEWLANGRRVQPPAKPEAPPITIIELAAAYLQFAKVYYRKEGKATSSMFRVKIAIKLLKSWYGREPAAEFGPLKFRAIQRSLIDARKSRRYVNYLTEQVKRIFKWGVSMELVPPQVFQALATVPGLRKGRSEAAEPEPIAPVADDQVTATIPHLPAVVADMVRFQRLTGCRPGEVCLARPIDIDRSASVWVYVPRTHKTQHHGKRRSILIGPKAQAILGKYLERPAEAYCFSPAEAVAQKNADRAKRRRTPPNQGNSAGTNRRRTPKRKAGDCYTTATYGRAVRRAATRAKIPVWLPNRLRHTAATEIRRSFGAEAAQVVLGHSQLNVTELYAERDTAKAAEIMRLIG